MKRNWKKSLFAAYEIEENFQDKKDEIKKRMVFREKQGTRSRLYFRYVSFAASLFVMVGAGLSAHVFFAPQDSNSNNNNPGNDAGLAPREDDFSSDMAKKDSIDEDLVNIKQDSRFIFGENKEFSISYVYYFQNNSLLIQDDNGNLSLDEFIVKENDEALIHENKEKMSFTCFFDTFGEHFLTWEYQRFQGEFHI